MLKVESYLKINEIDEKKFLNFLLDELVNFRCSNKKCTTKFLRPYGNFDVSMILTMLENLICVDCNKCYHCCKKIYKCK